jgi:hypothetical protein
MRSCWACGYLNELEDTDFGDHPCKNCGCIISIYNPNAPELPRVNKPTTSHEDWLNKREEEMDLKNWSKDNAKFIKIKDGETYEGIYKGCKPGVNMNGEPAVIYDFDGKEFKSSSTILADKFSQIKEGTTIKLSRTGEGLQTKWKVESL